jgi:4-amino-4-deoxy-L-arabinose transferase-like glycosyltransferase
MNRRTVLFILCVILAAGTALRTVNLGTWPREGATFDEFAWTFLGLNLINTGVPVSWSPHAAYTNTREYYNPQGAHFRLVTPYLEHPPLFGLVAGLSARAVGARTFDDVKVGRIRYLALAMGVAAIAAVYLLSSAIYGERVGLVSAGVYAVIPTVVAGSRIVQNENFFIPLFLLLLYFVHRFADRGGGKGSLAVVLLLSFLLPLAKVPWIAAPAAAAGCFAVRKNWKAAGLTVLAAVLSVGTYIAWGMYWNRELFGKLMALQTARYDMSFDGFLSLVTMPLVTDRLYTDGWIYFGWIAMALLIADKRKSLTPVTVGFLAYLGIYLFAIPNEAGHGWYRYPFYPFLAIAIAAFLTEMFDKNRIMTFVALAVVGLPLFEHVWVPVFGFSYAIYRVYIALSAIGMLPLVFSSRKLATLSSAFVRIAAVAVVLLSVAAGLGYNEQ